MFLPLLFSLWARKDIEKLCEETVYKQRSIVALGAKKKPKLPEIPEQSGGTRQVYVLVFFFDDHV